MRRCHSDAMGDYRREHNQEMWERPSTPVYPGLALHNLQKRLDQAARLFVEEMGVGE